MADISIPWAPRLVLSGRTVRLPVQATGEAPDLDAGEFELLDQRWSKRDKAFFYYLKAPEKSGDYALEAVQNGHSVRAIIQVRTLDDLRRPHEYNGVCWPRRWPVGQDWHSTKTRQTLQDLPISPARNEEVLTWWKERDDEVVWRQLPPADLPRAHYVNVHQGCPNCGTAIFTRPPPRLKPPSSRRVAFS